MNDKTPTLTTDVAFGSNPSTNLGLSGKTAVVHKTGLEGGLVIDAMSGQVLTSSFDLPEWAAGLSMALLAERHTFYQTRLGSSYGADQVNPEAYNADDLGWVGLDEEGQEVEVPASSEYRAGIVKSVLVAAGVIQDTDTAEGLEIVDGAGMESDTVMVNIDRLRTEEEVAAIQKASVGGFLPLAKTGTQG